MTDLPEFTDIHVRLRSGLIAPQDSIITDRHHASQGNYEDDDPANQIGGTILANGLSGWLRHGIERVVQERGGTPCHPAQSNLNFRKEELYEDDLDSGYHEKGNCAEDGNPCIVYDLFGGLNQPGKIMRRPIEFSPVRSGIDYHRGQAEGHYRRVTRQIASRSNPERESLTKAEVDAVANLEGAWHLVLRDPKPEFVGLLVAAVDYLDNHKTDLAHQFGGSRNQGAGIMDCKVLNPLYTDSEVDRVFHRNSGSTNQMDEKDDRWMNELKPQYIAAFNERIEDD